MSFSESQLQARLHKLENENAILHKQLEESLELHEHMEPQIVQLTESRDAFFNQVQELQVRVNSYKDKLEDTKLHSQSLQRQLSDSRNSQKEQEKLSEKNKDLYNELRQQYYQLRQQIESETTSKNNAYKELKDAQRQIHQLETAGQAKTAQLENQISQLTQQVDTLSQGDKTKSAQHKELVADLNNKLSSLQETVRASAEQRELMEQRLQRAIAAKQEYADQIESMRTKYQSLEKRSKQLEQELNDTLRTHRELEHRNVLTEDDLNEAKTRIKSLEHTIEDNQEQLAIKIAHEESLQRQLEKEKSDRQNIDEQMSSLRKRTETSEAVEYRLRGRIRRLKAKLRALQQEYSDLIGRMTNQANTYANQGLEPQPTHQKALYTMTVVIATKTALVRFNELAAWTCNTITLSTNKHDTNRNEHSSHATEPDEAHFSPSLSLADLASYSSAEKTKLRFTRSPMQDAIGGFPEIVGNRKLSDEQMFHINTLLDIWSRQHRLHIRLIHLHKRIEQAVCKRLRAKIRSDEKLFPIKTSSSQSPTRTSSDIKTPKSHCVQTLHDELLVAIRLATARAQTATTGSFSSLCRAWRSIWSEQHDAESILHLVQLHHVYRQCEYASHSISFAEDIAGSVVSLSRSRQQVQQLAQTLSPDHSTQALHDQQWLLLCRIFDLKAVTCGSCNSLCLDLTLVAEVSSSASKSLVGQRAIHTIAKIWSTRLETLATGVRSLGNLCADFGHISKSLSSSSSKDSIFQKTVSLYAEHRDQFDASSMLSLEKMIVFPETLVHEQHQSDSFNHAHRKPSDNTEFTEGLRALVKKSIECIMMNVYVQIDILWAWLDRMYDTSVVNDEFRHNDTEPQTSSTGSFCDQASHDLYCLLYAFQHVGLNSNAGLRDHSECITMFLLCIAMSNVAWKTQSLLLVQNLFTTIQTLCRLVTALTSDSMDASNSFKMKNVQKTIKNDYRTHFDQHEPYAQSVLHVERLLRNVAPVLVSATFIAYTKAQQYLHALDLLHALGLGKGDMYSKSLNKALQQLVGNLMDNTHVTTTDQRTTETSNTEAYDTVSELRMCLDCIPTRIQSEKQLSSLHRLMRSKFTKITENISDNAPILEYLHNCVLSHAYDISAALCTVDDVYVHDLHDHSDLTQVLRYELPPSLLLYKDETLNEDVSDQPQANTRKTMASLREIATLLRSKGDGAFYTQYKRNRSLYVTADQDDSTNAKYTPRHGFTHFSDLFKKSGASKIAVTLLQCTAQLAELNWPSHIDAILTQVHDANLNLSRYLSQCQSRGLVHDTRIFSMTAQVLQDVMTNDSHEHYKSLYERYIYMPQLLIGSTAIDFDTCVRAIKRIQRLSSHERINSFPICIYLCSTLASLGTLSQSTTEKLDVTDETSFDAINSVVSPNHHLPQKLLSRLKAVAAGSTKMKLESGTEEISAIDETLQTNDQSLQAAAKRIADDLQYQILHTSQESHDDDSSHDASHSFTASESDTVSSPDGLTPKSISPGKFDPRTPFSQQPKHQNGKSGGSDVAPLTRSFLVTPESVSEGDSGESHNSNSSLSSESRALNYSKQSTSENDQDSLVFSPEDDVMSSQRSRVTFHTPHQNGTALHHSASPIAHTPHSNEFSTNAAYASELSRDKRLARSPTSEVNRVLERLADIRKQFHTCLQQLETAVSRNDAIDSSLTESSQISLSSSMSRSRKPTRGSLRVVQTSIETATRKLEAAERGKQIFEKAVYPKTIVAAGNFIVAVYSAEAAVSALARMLHNLFYRDDA